MSLLQQYRFGLMLSALGMVVISPDGLLMRLISDADIWQTAFYRTLLMGLSLLAVLAWRERGRIVPLLRKMDRTAWVSTVLFSIGNISFVAAITQTTVANTLIIIACMPLFSALFGWMLIGERVAMRTWVAIGATLVGIGILFSGSLHGQGAGSDVGLGQGPNLVGDMLALVTALAQALNLVVMRKAHVTMTLNRTMLPLCLSGFISAGFCLLLVGGAAGIVTGHDFIVLALIGLVVLPVALTLFFSGARYVPAAEVALLSLIEAVLGPVWVWLVIGEAPGHEALVGGCIVIVAIAIHAIISDRVQRQRHKDAITSHGK